MGRRITFRLRDRFYPPCAVALELEDPVVVLSQRLEVADAEVAD